ncbi:MAG: nucleoside transporter C-terminal domain-containing protein [Planctomycetota bacterium]|jgi:CNT family concentrative nucleoside transporter
MGIELSLLLGVAGSGFSSLNFVSLLGIGGLLLLAWGMGSERSRVNWRLVLVGMLLQFAIAAVLFNSQSWTFPTARVELNSTAKLAEFAKQTPELSAAVEQYVQRLTAGENLAARGLEAWRESLGSSPEALAAADRLVAANPPVLPQFPRGVLFYGVEQFFNLIKNCVEAGTSFVFRLNPGPEDRHDPLLLLKAFTFGVIPTVIFFGALMSVLYYLGVMRWVVQGMAWGMQRLLGTSGAESLAAAANVLIGQTEAPLVIKPFVTSMTRSELNCLMLGGFATISGSLMAVFASLGVSAGHLLTASIISAPAALVVSKILQPETERPLTLGTVEMPRDNEAVNVIDAAAQGASDGMRLAINVIAMLIAFLALIALIDAILWGIGELAQGVVNSFSGSDSLVDYHWTIKGIFSVLFAPLAWLMGISPGECYKSGEILGTKMVVNEFVAYLDLVEVMDQMRAEGANAKVQLSERTQIILTYALCGFSNFASVGIQIGGIGALAPERRGDLAQLGLRAMLGGMIACCLTACVAGVLYGVI